MKKEIAGKQELENTVNSYYKFVKSLNLTKEQQDLYEDFLKNLLEFITISDGYGIEAYNDLIYRRSEFNEIRKCLDR